MTIFLSENAPDTKTIKIEGIFLAIRSSLSVAYVVRARDANGRRDMVSKTL
jgi:hypothetical protein